MFKPLENKEIGPEIVRPVTEHWDERPMNSNAYAETGSRLIQS